MIEECESAIEYDLLTRAGRSLADVPARLSWHSLACFTRHLDADSATYAATHPESAGWNRMAYMMADIYDAARAVEYAVAASASRKRPRMPRPYPRPQAQRKMKLGKGAVPLNEFDSWWRGD